MGGGDGVGGEWKTGAGIGAGVVRGMEIWGIKGMKVVLTNIWGNNHI